MAFYSQAMAPLLLFFYTFSLSSFLFFQFKEFPFLLLDKKKAIMVKLQTNHRIKCLPLLFSKNGTHLRQRHIPYYLAWAYEEPTCYDKKSWALTQHQQTS
jgi:hypothetical protein